ncbi:polysaccharide deacetylase family protein [Actinoplanes sp. TBRC 11911]|uniref:polysaccharide deacetylase family protein n=1 Tax=Actinoplanes sp. TBRC 11911 TaxID=2729386 RepID=UPI00145EFB4A|nr:polysaccharide deacetylase family protein [Actinoplanes sp. TBRC 11911]NMO53725.1 polysaccharide deacetylase family protein [Actinoplanes sp. TBRC 11911]
MSTAQLVGVAVAAAAAAYAGPALAAVGPARRRLLPALSGVGDRHHVALTFDDGPHPEATPEVLRLLDIAGVRATFFLLGRMAEEHPGVARAIVDAGHEIGLHGYEHRLLLKRRVAATLGDLARGCASITAITGQTPRWWRPPYGVASTAALLGARRLGLTPVLWTCWGRDWTPSATPESVFRTVRRGLRGGGTILLHDSDHAATPLSWENAVGALPAILTYCQARGFEVGPLAEHGIH